MRDSEYLFVGGRVIALTYETETVRVPNYGGGKVETYIRMEIYGRNDLGDQKTFVIYRHEDVNQIEAMNKLINNYNSDKS